MTSVIFTCMMFATAAGPTGPIRVDLNPNNGRGDVVTPGWSNWAFDPASSSRDFDGVTVTLRSASPLGMRWYKPLLVHGATITSDGVGSADSIELELRGLSPGRHTLATFHNRLSPGEEPRYDISVGGVVKISRLKPSYRVEDDAMVACGFVEFEAGPPPVSVKIMASGGDRDVVLNGFEVDAFDPNRKAIQPNPSDRDGHADADSGEIRVSWASRSPAVRHEVYVGTDRTAVDSAGHSSPEYRGSVNEAEYRINGLSSHQDAFWRVDEIDPSGVVTKGDTWSFRPRHLAFPGAEGFGRFARGGRGGRVIEVTNLNDEGPGSLRAAVAAEGPRTVVFRVSGVIRLRSPITVTQSYLTIAGETAPGDGICLRGYSFGTATSSSDVIVRHLRVRVGDESKHSMDGMGLGGRHTIFDHCSISWSIDEGLDSRTARDATFQRCMISEALDASFQRHPHGFAGSIGGERVSYHHNLLAHCAGRNWSLAGGYDNAVRFAGRIEIRNNVVYNWSHRTTDGGAKTVDFVANYYKPGPASRVFHLVKADIGKPEDRQVYHIVGNVLEGHPEYELDNWRGVTLAGNAPLSEIRSETPLLPSSVTTTSATQAYSDVLADVGATRPRLDEIDRRIIQEVRTGTAPHRGSKGKLPGIIDTPTDLGSEPWPTYRTYSVPNDSDHDGLPDAWERAHKANPHSPAGDFSDANSDPDGDGYTQLEEFLHELATSSTVSE